MIQLAPQLRALGALAEHDGHVTEAAAALNMPQSSMSRRIHSLEAMLRVPLIIRNGRGVRLTPAGLALAQQTRNPLRELAAAIARTAGDADPDRGTVRFGFPFTMGAGEVPDLLAEFHSAYPGVHLQLKQAHGSALVNDLQRGELDVAITIPPPGDLQHTVLATQRISAVVPEHHRLAGRGAVDLRELSNETFIANPPSYNLRQLTEDWCLKLGFKPSISVEITEFATIRELIARNLGIALLPRTERPVPGTVDLRLQNRDCRREIALAWAADRPSAVARRFIEFVLERGIRS